EHIVLVGYSLGTGLAARLAANNRPRQLVLLAPYLSMVDMKDRVAPILPDFLLKYHLNTDAYLRKTDLPITIFHGEADDVIPVDSSRKLKALKPAAVRLVTMDGVGHRGVIFNQAFRNGLRELLR
ncbi:MAG: alpha/beta hydrolase, partial [Saprospiraceae bacterium]